MDDRAAAEVEAPLELRRVLVGAMLGVMGFTVLAAGLGWLFHEPAIELGQWFVGNFGGPGIAVGFFFPDAFTVPIPNDAFTAIGLFGGMNFAEVVFWGSLGSLTGGTTGWAIGRYLLSRSRKLQSFIERRGGEQIRAQLIRGGRWFLAIAAVSPIPYSVTCWATGATKMPYWEFFLISLLRIPRIAGVLWLVKQGFMGVTNVTGW
jgi:membrane protein YqaA with SNARE-associated domain